MRPGSFKELVDLILSIINNALIPLIFSVAFLVFLWGVLKYYLASGEEDKKTGRTYILWGILGLFFMVSVWGFVSLLKNTFF